ncbi:hypothetical protein [Prosthecobacter debontii]|nr:hypothetical protein [Prosthecobacter debontii]
MPVPLLRDFSDRLSPMLVKELRHGLRTRIFTSMLIVFQLGMILLISTVMMGAPMEVVGTLFWSLSLLALLGAFPLRGFNALTSEVQGGTLDMLRLTSIPAFRIVWGKWLALFCQVLLLAASLLPYMVARYQFGGVEVAQEALALAMAVLISAIATAAYVALSSQRSLVLRLFLAAGVIGLLMPATGVIFATTYSTSGGQLMQAVLGLSGLEIAGLLIGGMVLTAYAVFTLLALAASRIASISENHSTWKRLVHLAMISLLVLISAALVFHSEAVAAMWALVPTLILTLFIGMDVMTEDMPPFATVIKKEAEWRRFPRFLARLFYPGWASGVYFYGLLMTAVLSVFGLHMYQHKWHAPSEQIFMFICVAAVPVVPVCVPLNKDNRIAQWCRVQIFLGIIGVLISIFGDLAALGTLTPLTGLMASFANYVERGSTLAVSAAIGGVWLIVAMAHARMEGLHYPYLESVVDSLRLEENASPSSTASPIAPAPPVS